MINDPMWRLYPKQVQNILKKKRIDRERLRRSLKPPGKRNYKTLFGNVKKVANEEVYKASSIFKDILGDYYKLINAEKKVYKALHEKGLFLDKKDFNIMEVFNAGYSDYSDYEEEEENDENVPIPHNTYNSKHIEVEEFEPTQHKIKEEKHSEGMMSHEDVHNYQNNLFKRQRDTPTLDLPSIDHYGSLTSPNFEKISNISRHSNDYQNNFVPKSSHRMLFQDYKVERRPKEFIHCSKNDFV